MPKRGTAPTCYPVRVFCRVLPLPTQQGTGCVKVNQTTSIILTTPPQLLESQKAQWQRETRHVFKYVFDPEATQHQVFETSAKPLVEELIHGHNALLLAYGITGSGKTFTMTGNKEKRGILPRCLDLLFRTISDYQTARFVFKPDRSNGFTVQSYKMALKERMKPLTKHSRSQKRDSAMEIASLPSEDEDNFTISELDGDNMYAVFITYIEVYNNVVYDLLEEGSSKKGLQQKIICEDTEHNTMFVPGAVELEVKSAGEAIQVFRQGQQRKRMAETILNVESSRSHTVFNIRLVQAPFDHHGEYKPGGKKNILISQLSLVDLAGSERCCRSNNSGVRLREAGNINNSLMTLRTCLKSLRDNQKAQANTLQKTIPYRQSKITHLFKKFFDGEGQISMIVCVNPRAENYEENVQVMEFAEMSQQIEISRVTPKNSKTSLFLSQDSKQLLEKCHIDVDDLNEDDDSEMNDILNHHDNLFSVAGKCGPDMNENSPVPESFKLMCADLNIKLKKVKEENNQLNMDLSALRTAHNKEQKCAALMKESMQMQERDVYQLNNELGHIKRKIKQKNQEIRKLRKANVEQKRQYKQRVKEVLETFNQDLDDTPQTPCARCRSIRLLKEAKLSARSLAPSSRCSCCSSSTASEIGLEGTTEAQSNSMTKEGRSLPKQTPRNNTRRNGDLSTRRPPPMETSKPQKSGEKVSSTSIVEQLEQFKLNHKDIENLPSIQACDLGSFGTRDCVKVLLALWQWCNE